MIGLKNVINIYKLVSIEANEEEDTQLYEDILKYLNDLAVNKMQ